MISKFSEALMAANLLVQNALSVFDSTDFWMLLNNTLKINFSVLVFVFGSHSFCRFC